MRVPLPSNARLLFDYAKEFGAETTWRQLESGALPSSVLRQSSGQYVGIPPEQWRRTVTVFGEPGSKPESRHPVELIEAEDLSQFGRWGGVEVGQDPVIVPNFADAEIKAAIDTVIAIARRPAGVARPDGDAIHSTGMAGRRTSAHLIDQEFKRRAAAGDVWESLSREAAHLAEWFKLTHPTAPPCTAGTIENRIRSAYNALKATK